MLEAIEKDWQERFMGEEVYIQVHILPQKKKLAKQWKAEIESRFPNTNVEMRPLSLSVACHIGPGALAVTCTKKMK